MLIFLQKFQVIYQAMNSPKKPKYRQLERFDQTRIQAKAKAKIQAFTSWDLN